MGRDKAEDLKKIYDWTQPTIELLSNLEHDLSGLLQEWETFHSPSGDIGYFSSISGRGSKLLWAIKETFEKLDFLRQRLVHLKDSSRRCAEDVSFAKFGSNSTDTLTHSYNSACSYKAIKLRNTALKRHSATPNRRNAQLKRPKTTPNRQNTINARLNLAFGFVIFDCYFYVMEG